MRVAIVGSRSLDFEIPENCIPLGATQIISGGAKGIDLRARQYAKKHKIQILEIVPDYDLYGKSAPLKRDELIVELADIVVAFWDTKSHGTKYVIDKCKETLTPVYIYYSDSMGIKGFELGVNPCSKN
ncbi:MAG: hypothetical protein ACI4GY_08395 [Acutalibacteraceae bacterium]